MTGIMQTLLNITLQPDGTPLVTSDFFSIEVKKTEKLKQWAKGPVRLEDCESNHPTLKENLIQWRREKAKELKLSAFIILTNRTLLTISDAAPLSAEELLAIRGVGNILYERYGEDILRIVEESLTQEELGL